MPKRSNINVKDTIALNNKQKYFVMSKATYEDNIYYLLTGINNTKDVKFCVEFKHKKCLVLQELNDKELLENLSLLFLHNLKKEYFNI